MNKEIYSKREQFEQAYFSFAKALRVASENADKQCEIMGFHNVAWEIRDDVNSGLYMLNVSDGFLSDALQHSIREFVAAVNNLPDYIFCEAISKKQNLETMRDPCWEAIRTQAHCLIKALQGVDENNQHYFGD